MLSCVGVLCGCCSCLESWMGMLPPGEEAAFHWPFADRKKHITVRHI